MLKKSFPASFNFAHISLAFIGLMWVLPFLYYHHAYPITTFYQEWGTALLGLCALPLLLTSRYWQAPHVPRIVMLPLGLMGVLLVQFLLGRINHVDHVLLLSLYFLLTILLMMLGQRLREELGLPWVATALAIFLVVGAELNTLAGLVQHYQWHTFLSAVVTAKTSASVYGNTAQPNHFANYIALGLFSLGLLLATQRLRNWQAALLALPMLFVLVLSGSRSGWLYLTFALVMAWLWQRKDKALRPLFSYALLLWLGYLAMHVVVQIPWLAGATGSVTAAERFFGGMAGGSIRVDLWREAWTVFTHFPLLGAGFGEFGYQHFSLSAEVQNLKFMGLYNNAHNIVLQIAAEAGLAGLGVLLLASGLFVWQSFVRQVQFNVYHWWGAAVLAVLAIHSLLEYPLWYAYFIGIAAVMLGVFERTTYTLELRLMGRLSVAALLILGGIFLLQAMQSYRQLETALIYRGMAAQEASYRARAQAELVAVTRYPLLGSYAEMYIAQTLPVSEDLLTEKLQLSTRALHYIPSAQLAYRHALLLALDNHGGAAQTQMKNAIWSYPGDFPFLLHELQTLASSDPARFAPLLEFATQNFEEYQRVAVSRK